MDEVREIPNFVGFFAGTDGKIYRQLPDGSYKKKNYTTNGGTYLRVQMYGCLRKVHILIAQTYLGDTKGLEVHHVNKNKRDNRLENLMILTADEHDKIHQRGKYEVHNDWH